MDCTGAMRFDFRKSFLFDGCNYHLESLGASSIEHKQGKTSIAGNEAEFFLDSHQ